MVLRCINRTDLFPTLLKATSIIMLDMDFETQYIVSKGSFHSKTNMKRGKRKNITLFILKILPKWGQDT